MERLQRLGTGERKKSKTIFHVDSSVFGESFVSIPGMKEFAGTDVRIFELLERGCSDSIIYFARNRNHTYTPIVRRFFI